MNPFSDCFTLCYSMLYTVLIQLIICFFIKPNTCPYIDRVIYFRSACAWTQFIPPHFRAHINYIKCTLKSQVFFNLLPLFLLFLSVLVPAVLSVPHEPCKRYTPLQIVLCRIGSCAYVAILVFEPILQFHYPHFLL